MTLKDHLWFLAFLVLSAMTLYHAEELGRVTRLLIPMGIIAYWINKWRRLRSTGGERRRH